HQPLTLAIGASLTIAEYILPKLLSRYLALPSPARLSVMMANSRAIFDQVRHGEVDIGLIEANLFDPQLIVRPFLDDRPCAVVPHFHPWAGRPEVTLPEFLEQPLILREPGSGTRQALEESLNHVGVDLQSLNVRLVLATTQAIKAMIISGLGISILSPFTIHSTETHLLLPIRVHGLNLYRNFYVVHRRDLNSRLAHHFIQALLQSRFGVVNSERDL
ncbi:MAG: LysR substrate-binding domain-containing protein, partial [Sulfobacillus sp.]